MSLYCLYTAPPSDGEPCMCNNCRTRAAKVAEDSAAKRKALLALDQAMTDLASADFSCWNHSKADGEYIIGLASNCNDAWRAARRFILPEERPE